MKKLFVRIFFLIPIIFIAVGYLNIANAQPGNPGGTPAIPIDGGLSYLIAGGILYGVHRLRKSRKK
ncbi:MAG TPA: hypothetical protein DDY13_09275 [Cytophagales bacterium]|jgi:hypothetical protein|nr:hypothetical protein [Cytophagales bacterium]